MSIVAIPYTFTNGLPLDATQLNANFLALAGGLGSGLATTGFTNITATALTLGTISYADTGVIYGAQGSLNGYVQDVVQNTNAGSAASADYVVSNNLGTALSYYGDFGINSSTFSGSGSLSLPNATYLYSANGDLVIGTYTANPIHFVVGNGATDAMSISATGVPTIALPMSPSSSNSYANAGNSTPVTGSSASVSFKWEQNADRTVESLGGLWGDKVYYNWAFNKQFTLANSPVSATNVSPAVSLLAMAENSGSQIDVCARMAVAYSSVSNTYTFGDNIIVTSAASLTGLHMTGLEIDMEAPASCTVTNGNGLIINAFNVHYPGAAILIGNAGYAGGYFDQGILIQAGIGTAGTCFAVSAFTTNVGLDLSQPTFNTMAILMGTGISHGIEFGSGGGGVSPVTYGDSSGNWITQMGAGNLFAIKEKTGVTNVLVVDGSGNGTFSGSALTTGTGGVGYATGAGTTGTQSTSRTTAIALGASKASGSLTLFTAAPTVGTPVTFAVTNVACAATDVVHVSVKSATNTYTAFVTATGINTFSVTLTSVVGTASDTPVLNFAVIKAVVS